MRLRSNLAVAAASLVVACSRGGSGASSGEGAEAGPTFTAAPAMARAGTDERIRGDLVRIAATNQVSVLDIPAWPETAGSGAKRLGYLRHGAVVEAYEGALINSECREGWFELAGGAGWICSKYATVDLDSPRVRLAPRQPDLDAGMPYSYAVNVTDGTPLYRRVLGAEDRKKFEGKPKSEDSDNAEKSDKTDTVIAAAVSETTTTASPSGQAETDQAIAATTAAEEERPSAPSPSVGRGVEDAGADAGPRERPKLRELRGRGVLVRKMSRGFYVALDRDFKAAGTRWWRTSFGFAAPYDKLMVRPSSTKHVGNWFEAPPAAEPEVGEVADAGEDLAFRVGFSRKGGVAKITLSEDGKKTAWSGSLPERSAVMLTGRVERVGGAAYYEAAGGFFVTLAGLELGKPSIPEDLGPNEKWIDVDLTRQTLTAFEGRRPVFATYVSSGRRNLDDKERDFPTPTGTFRIGEKHVTTTMDGDVASDGPYSIEDVPWVMYFQGSYALHGAFWHDRFGNVRSHGCVNLSPDDARVLFGWVDPPLPEGWHGAFAVKGDGTRVVVHEDKKLKPRY